jgi:CDP-glycerol glycerophosphotransferase (TagB/SpsB family)
MQHGLIFDTTEAFMMNKYQGALGLNTDYQLVWGDVDYQYRKKLGFDPEKIIKIGSPAHDHFFDKKNSKRDYVLLATSGPTTEDIFDLTVESIARNIETIKGISKIVAGLNQKLIIKIHPSPDEFDPTELIKSIDPNIQVIKTGDISEIIKNCSLMIVIDFSSVILDAYLLKKPIISIPVKNNGYGLPKAFVNNSCMIENLETLENLINNLLKNDNSELIKNATISGQNYMSNLGNASEQLLRFLSTQGKN